MDKNYTKKYFKELKKLITNKDFLIITLSVYLGTELKSFFQKFVKDIAMPIILILLPDRIKDYSIKFRGKKLEIEDVIESFISLSIALSMLLIYSLVKTLLKIHYNKLPSF